jgi:hypothetical protein
LPGVEGAEATPAPRGCKLLWRSLIAFLSEPKLVGDFEEDAEGDGTIIIDKFEEASL